MSEGLNQSIEYKFHCQKSKIISSTNKWEKSIVDLATGKGEDKTSKDELPATEAALGRKGGLKGGKAVAELQSTQGRSEFAKKAARVRWGHKED